MSGFRTFAVVSRGLLGGPVIDHLLRYKQKGEIDSVILLTRSSSNQNNDDLIQQGVVVRTLNYDEPASLTACLEGIDVVISTLSGQGLGNQELLAKAAKPAGVKLFVPSEFGMDTTKTFPGLGGTLVAPKTALHQVMKDAGLPYALFYPGGLPEFFFLGGFQPLTLANGKVTIGGTGDGPISWTSVVDVADYVTYVLINLPREKLEWKVFRIEAERKSLNELFAEYERQSGKTLTVTKVDKAELDTKAQTDFGFWFLLYLEDGQGVAGNKAELTMNRYPGWKPKRIVDVISQV